MKKFYVILILLCSLLPLSARAQESSVGVVISEINWAGSSASNADEWIELTNRTSETVDIGGWILTGSATGGDALIIEEGSLIEPGKIYLIANYGLNSEKTTLDIEPEYITSNLSLTNSGTEITLTEPNGTIVDEVSENMGSANPFVSIERNLETLEWQEATTSANLLDPDQLGTPGIINETSALSTNEAAEAEELTCMHDLASLRAEIARLESLLALSAESVSIDPIQENDPEVAPVFEEEIRGTVETDEVFEVATLEEDIEIEDESPSTTTSYRPNDVLINEFVSNPELGEEWIEFLTMTDVDLTGWQIQDASGKATLLEGDYMTGDFIVIESPKGQLNNGGDEILLLDATGNIIDFIVYGDEYPAPKKGEALARTLDDEWRITTERTPGQRNTFPVIYEETIETSGEKSEDRSGAIATNEGTTEEIADDDTISASSVEGETEEEVEEADDDTEARVSGIVTALPGTFGKQVAYIDGQQLYFYHADWPELALGDQITVHGEFSTARGESRLKISSQEDIVITGAGTVMPQPAQVSELITITEGTLVQVHGDYITRNGSKLTLEDETGSLVVFAHDNTGITWADHQSAQLEVTGILRFIDGETRIYPRSDKDVTEYVQETEEMTEDKDMGVMMTSENFDSVIGATVSDVSSWGPWIGGTLVTATGAILAYWFVKYRLDLNSTTASL